MMQKIEDIINERVKARLVLVDAEQEKDKPDYREADKIQAEITEYIKSRWDLVPVDFILETLTHFGQAPAVVYDDDGYWQVSGGGYHELEIRKEESSSMMVMVEQKGWFDTIRKALWYYMFESE